MKSKFFIFILLLLYINHSKGQSYFDLFYTNIPESKADKYSILNSKALGWLQTGNYSFPKECSSCADYSRNSVLTKRVLDSLVVLYNKSEDKKLHSTQYIPNYAYYAPDKKAGKPYMIKTLYKIVGNNPVAVYQIIMTFYEKPDSEIGIENIEIISSKPFRLIDPKIVMNCYALKLNEDLNDSPPPIQKKQ